MRFFRDFVGEAPDEVGVIATLRDRKSTRLNSSHGYISYAVFCLKKNKNRTAWDSFNTTWDGYTDLATEAGHAVVAVSSGLGVPDSRLPVDQPSEFFFFLKDRAPTEIYPFPLPDALPI